MKLSIIIATYDSEKTLSRTLDSIEGQTLDEIEVIVIDGNSSDGTMRIVEEFSSKAIRWISEPDKGIYDALLDDYEPGESAETIQKVFSELKAELVPMIDKIISLTSYTVLIIYRPWLPSIGMTGISNLNLVLRYMYFLFNN